jgi:hypothetical protein
MGARVITDHRPGVLPLPCPDDGDTHRGRYVAALRDLAQWLEDNPHIPVPAMMPGVQFTLFEDESGSLVADFQRIAASLETFGPVERRYTSRALMLETTVGRAEYLVYAPTPHGNPLWRDDAQRRLGIRDA